ncbi:MAG: ABC transporter ATP-binding protein [Pseudomonadota bacterium]
MAELRLEAAYKRFGETTALDGLDLDVADGEFFVLLGPTGAGKTTTLRVAAGLEKPEAGRVRLGGLDVTALPPAARDVAFVFQQYSLYPHLSVYDNLAFPLRSPVRRSDRATVDARVREVAGRLRIDSKLRNRATRLSGGEMQRVAIGRALVRAPALFLMDEPLSSLDAKLREELRIELKRLQRELGATILYVTHDQVEAMTLADRIGLLEQGRLLQVGTPRDIYTRPATIEAAARLGSPPINLLPPNLLPGLAGPAGTERIGLRPEDVELDLAGDGAEVVQIEHLGAETVVRVRCRNHELHALVPGETVLTPGSSVGIAPIPGALMAFGSAGERLERTDGGAP